MKRRASLAQLLSFVAIVILAVGCKRASDPASVSEKTPSLRLYVVGGVAGALEPCGCVENMLGGIDHLSAVVSKRRTEAPQQLLLGAGPMLFSDPEIVESRRAQTLIKADALAASFREVGLTGWAPGANDWAAGASKLSTLAEKSGATLLAGNLNGKIANAQSSSVVQAGGFRVGLAGVSEPRADAGAPAGVEIGDPAAALTQQLASLKQEKAQIFVALVALGRGKALRLAETVPGFHLMVVGKPYDRGEQNDATTDPVRIGTTLVVEVPNHLQAVAVIDLFIKDSNFDLHDAVGLDHVREKGRLERRIQELESRLTASRRAGVASADLSARQGDLDRYRAELKRLTPPSAPKDVSFFRYELIPLREDVGTEPKVKQKMDEYYQRVNAQNKEAFASVLPEPAAAGESSYLGVKACSACHVEEAAFWRTTRHATAYETLSHQHKEYNLDCVSCHVTGYEKPGGSTLVHVDELTSVQCEVCHGPGSRHLADPAAKGLIIAAPERNLCARSCHHSPHVETGWSVDEAWPNILGKGHGR